MNDHLHHRNLLVWFRLDWILKDTC